MKKRFYQKGMALLLTLTIVLVLSLALTQLFEQNAVEIKLLENSQSHLRAEVKARSIFRLILLLLSEKSTTNEIYNGLSKQGVLDGGEFPILEDLVVSNLQLKSLDHHVNLHCSFTTDGVGGDRTAIFSNIINILYQRKSTGAFDEITAEQIQEMLGAFLDWTDKDPENNQTFPPGAEEFDYVETKPEYFIKNRLLDLMSELTIMKYIEDMKFTWEDWEEYFTIYRVGDFASNKKGKYCSAPQMNINIASKEEIVQFLDIFDNIATYTNIYFNREDLADFIVKTDFGLRKKFVLPLNKNAELKEELELLGVPMKEADLVFKTGSLLWQVEFSVQSGSVTKKVRSILRMDSKSSDKEIVYFTLR